MYQIHNLLHLSRSNFVNQTYMALQHACSADGRGADLMRLISSIHATSVMYLLCRHPHGKICGCSVDVRKIVEKDETDVCENQEKIEKEEVDGKDRKVAT